MNREFQAQRLDVRAFASAAGEIGGASVLSDWPRLHAEVQAPGAEPMVHWQARGEMRDPAGAAQVWLHLQANTMLPLICQRCLTPVAIALAVDRSFRFVADERTATEQDDAAEEDLLVLGRRFNLLELIEDELLMAMPLVALHEACPVQLSPSAVDPDFEETTSAKAGAFADLGRLLPPAAKA
jgi:uncharacterized protein